MRHALFWGSTRLSQHRRAERLSRGCGAARSPLKRGRSANFVDPELTAHEARHVWLPDACTSVLHIHALPKSPDATSGNGIFFSEVPSVEHILVDSRGRQHIVLRANGVSLQIVVHGLDIVDLAVSIAFFVDDFNRISRAIRDLSTLRQILSSKTAPRTQAYCKSSSQNLRNALVSVDGRAAGASYQEIALLLHGADYVSRNWHTGLKARMRRHYARGLAYIGGRYRELL